MMNPNSKKRKLWIKIRNFNFELMTSSLPHCFLVVDVVIKKNSAKSHLGKQLRKRAFEIRKCSFRGFRNWREPEPQLTSNASNQTFALFCIILIIIVLFLIDPFRQRLHSAFDVRRRLPRRIICSFRQRWKV